MKQNPENNNNTKTPLPLYLNNPFSSEILRQLKLQHTNKSTSDIFNSFSSTTFHNFKLLNSKECLLKSSSIPAMNCEFISPQQKEQTTHNVKLLYQHNNNSNTNMNGSLIYYNKSINKNKTKIIKTRNVQRKYSYENSNSELITSMYKKYHSYMNGDYLKRKEKSSIASANSIKEEKKNNFDSEMFTITKESITIQPFDSKNCIGINKNYVMNRIKNISQQYNNNEHSKGSNSILNNSNTKYNNLIKPKTHRVQNMRNLYKYLSNHQH